MAAANTDKFKKISRRWVGQVGSGGVADNSTTTIPLSSTTNLATDTAVVVVIDRVNANGVSTPALEETVIGVVSGSNLINCVRGAEGTAQAHNAGAVVEVLFTAKGWNDLIDGLLVSHNQDGSILSGIALNSPVINGNLSGTAILDEDDMASDSATKVPSQQSVKAYVDAEIAGINTSSVNFATSGAQGTVAINNATPTDVSGVSVTINPTATATVHATVSGDIYSSNTTVDFQLDLVINGVTIQSVPLRTPGSNLRTSFSLNGQATVSSGARTIKLQAWSSPSAQAFTIDDANLSVIWS